MKNGLRKILVSLIACIGMGTACHAADIIGEIIIPDGKDGCNPQLQIDDTGVAREGCTSLKWGIVFSRDCEVTRWDTMEVCNGTDGNNACSPVASTETGTGDNDGCVRMAFQAKKGTNCDTNDGEPVYSKWVCNGKPSDVCEGLSATEKARTMMKTARDYVAPTGVTSSTYTSAYATAPGGYTVTSTPCSGAAKASWEPDNCAPVSVDSTALDQLPKCTGTIKSCVRSDNNETYYMCSGSCHTTVSSYTLPVRGPQDTNCLGGRCAANAPGRTTTVEKAGCGSGATTTTIVKEDTCSDPMILKASDNLTYTYYTCVAGDSAKLSSSNIPGESGKYSLRKPLVTGSAFKTISDTSVDVDELKNTVNDATNGLVTKVANLNTALASKMPMPSGTPQNGQLLKYENGAYIWANGANVQLHTFAGDSKLYYCTKTDGTSCSTSDPSDSWGSVEVGSLQGEVGKTAWLKKTSTAIQVCYKETACGDNDTWSTLVSLNDITGQAGRDACRSFRFEKDSTYTGTDGIKYNIYCND